MTRITWVLARDDYSEAIAGNTAGSDTEMDDQINGALIAAIAEGIKAKRITHDTDPERIRQIKTDLQRHRQTLSWPTGDQQVTLYTYRHND